MKIGLTERHGMADEQAKRPPAGVEYQFLNYKKKGSSWLASPMKGFMSTYVDDDIDLLESILTPTNTRKPWLYSLACFEEAVAFSFKGLPLPKSVRIQYMKHLFLKENFKGLLFWSEAGKRTLHTYANITDKRIWDKSHVVYPAIQPAPADLIQYKETDELNLLFNGNFFIKGGANVVDLFETLQKNYPKIKLRLCCSEDIDFHTDELELRNEYLTRIKSNPSITLGRVSRDEFINTILPNTDIYLLPTYGDAFGFAILEAMSFGIPVVSTNYMAIPEMIINGENGYMADISQYRCQSMFKGCYVSKLPLAFKEDINQQLLPILERLIQNPTLRKEIGANGIQTTMQKFSFETRQQRMNEIYSSLNL